jgi:hypothetical protein
MTEFKTAADAPSTTFSLHKESKMITLELAVATHKAMHNASGRQSKALRVGYTMGRNKWDERCVLDPNGDECFHTSEWHDDVLICTKCFSDGT